MGRNLLVSSLPDVLSQQQDDERRRSIRALLRHPLLTPEGPDVQAFALARRHAAWLGDWFAAQAGWTLHADHAVVRLRKVPGDNTDPSRGAGAGANQRKNGGRSGHHRFSRRRYVLACLALAALERAEAQITLGRLAERVIALAADPALAEAGVVFALDNAEERRDLVAIARLLLGVGVLARVAGDDQAFVTCSGDALYDVNRRVLATLLIARVGASTVTETGFEDRLRKLTAEPRPETDDARNREIRHRLARRLLDDPVLYYRDLTEEERGYLASQRGLLLRRLTEGTGFAAEVRAEGIALTDPAAEASDLGMPEEGTEGHFTLLLAGYLADAMRERPEAVISLPELHQHMTRIAVHHKTHWRKGSDEPGAIRELTDTGLRRLVALGLAKRTGTTVRPLPALARFGYTEPAIVGGQ
jgi:uncharacterized protein (TIGR02678 family)